MSHPAHEHAPILLVMTTFPDAEGARHLARLLVDARLAACVNVLPRAWSCYRWQGAVEEAEEVPLIIKTTASSYPDVEQAIRIAHPYELPEIIAWPIEHGLPEYLYWVAHETVSAEED